jgi:hypothetical protein
MLKLAHINAEKTIAGEILPAQGGGSPREA